MFCKNAKRCAENMFSTTLLKGSLQKYWHLVYKSNEKFFAKILRRHLQKYWEVFCKYIERCSAKLLTRVPHFDTKWTTSLWKLKDMGGGFYKCFRKYFIAQETIDLNVSWPSNFFRKYVMAPPINFSFLFKAYL